MRNNIENQIMAEDIRNPDGPDLTTDRQQIVPGREQKVEEVKQQLLSN